MMMSQHFLLSAGARTLSLRAVYAMGEEKAYETYCKLRWSETDGKPFCPRCGCVDAYRIPTRRKFKCAGCYHQYSVTSACSSAQVRQPSMKLFELPPQSSASSMPFRSAHSYPASWPEQSTVQG